MFCPVTGRDGPGQVIVMAGRIVAANWRDDVDHQSETGKGKDSPRMLDFPNGILLPGLIDMHAHPAGSLSKYSVNVDEHFLQRGTTTVMSQGDVGAIEWPAFREQIVGGSRTRVLLAINLAATGEHGPAACFADPASLDIDACVKAIGGDDAAIWGLAVNLSANSCGQADPRTVLQAALNVANATGNPLLLGPRRGADDLAWEEQLAVLRPGDVVTYCFDGGPHSIVRAGRVRPCVQEAQARGVLFDLGHGASSFDFATAEAAIGRGFLPDTISTDLHCGHVGQTPPHDLPRTISKLIAAGMTAEDAFIRATWRPALALSLDGEIGSLRPGTCADLTVLQCVSPNAALADTRGATRMGPLWQSVQTVRAGKVMEATDA
ncbi:MAG: amidohydrolase family protein [Pirellulales bacterium]